MDKIKKIVKNVTNNYINRQMLFEYISSINKNKLNKQKVNYAINGRFTMHDSRLFMLEQVDGNINYSVPLETVRKELSEKYGLEDWQFQIHNVGHKIEIAIIFYDVDRNSEIIENDMYKMGYFKGIEDKIYIEDEPWKRIQFEPIYQNAENNEIRDIRYLFHITPKYNLESIKKYGIKPSHKNDAFNYPDRVYFISSKETQQYVNYLGQMLCNANKDERNNGEYCILTIDLSVVPSDIDFYYDPHVKGGIFTNKTITPDSIIEERNVKFIKF